MRSEAVLPANSNNNKPSPQLPQLHPAAYVGVWIFFSGSVILFNKWVLDTAGFPFPIFLTTWHLVFATIMTHILKRTTHLLDGLQSVKMDGRTYLRAIVPIGVFFSLSLICSNQAYLYLSVAFIQMLKATTPVAVLITSWALKTEEPDLKKLANVSIIVVGIVLASYGEIAFVLTGFIYQALGITFESIRLVMVQKLLSSAEYKMDPLVSLYYFAPVCAIMNAIVCLLFEGSSLTLSAITNLGFFTLFLNASVAFCLNVAVVFLIGKTSSLVLTLSGVLKDILLVGLSILIWGTTITFLQIIGYSIALGGLVYYKLGGEQAKNMYQRLMDSETSPFKTPGSNRALFARIGGAISLLLLMVFMFHTALAPGESADSTEAIISSDTLQSTASYSPPHQMDIIVPVLHGDDQLAETARHLNELLDLASIRPTNPHIVAYKPVDSNIADEVIQQVLGATTVVTLPPQLPRRPEAMWIYHLVTSYTHVGGLSVFLPDDSFDVATAIDRILSTSSSKGTTGFLSSKGYTTCDCRTCPQVPFIGELYSASKQALCPSSPVLLNNWPTTITASARRLRANPLSLYVQLQRMIEVYYTTTTTTTARLTHSG